MKANRNQAVEVDSEEEELREILDDLLDEAVLRERIRKLDLDDESNLITEEELMAELGITEEDLAKVGDVRID